MGSTQFWETEFINQKKGLNCEFQESKGFLQLITYASILYEYLSYMY